MDPIGENENPSVDTNLKEEQPEQVNQNTLNEKKEEEHHQVKEDEPKEQEKEQIPSTEKDTKVDSSVQEHRQEDKPQPDQEPLANAAPEDKDNQKDKESGKEKESLPQSKHWKNTRKKKNKDEQLGDVTQWPTPDEARHSKGQPQKKTQGEAGRNSSKSERDRDNKNANRGRKGINWKPLTELPKTQGTGDQPSASSGPTSSSPSGEGERVGTTSASSSGGRSYQSSYSRGQPKRRGSGRPQTSAWPRSSNVAGGAQQFSQDGTTPSESSAPLAQETEGKEDTQVSQDSTSTSQGAPGQTTNPQDSRRYRGSSRGSSSRGSNRFGRGGGNFTRGAPYRYPNTRGPPPIPAVRPPQDPEQLREVTKKQIEYYFGVDNLCKDIFLRKNMNNEGWISIHLILNFNRVRDLNIDAQRFIDALKDSQVVETKDEFIRRRDDWARWTFPPRVEAQNSSTKAEEGVAQTTGQAN